MRNDIDQYHEHETADPIRHRECSDRTPSRHRFRYLWSALIPMLVTACATDTSDGSAASATTIESSTAEPDVSGDPEGQGQGVAIALDEWNVIGPDQIDVGTITLAIENDGTMNHQLSIVAADSYESLPRRENGSVITEELDTSQVLLVTEPLFAGFAAETFTVDLETGTYLFFCALQSFSGDESHARLGQRKVVTVS